MDYQKSIVDLIGRTPLLQLSSVPDGRAPLILAKVEYLNPGGSVKDRIGLTMIEAAEESGELKPGGTIVEPTSGNTGVGLALAAQRRGYRYIFVCPDKVSSDKINVMRAYGAEVVVCPTAVPPEHPDSYYRVSDRLVQETPGAWKPDQYANPNNAKSHYLTTGPEIWEQTRGRVTHFVTGIGTGGTVTGTGRFLKERSDGRVRVIGADPQGSVYSGGDGRPYLVEGVGEDFWPTSLDRSVIDEVVAISDAEAFAMTRRLAREEGLLVGGSSGLAVAAALRVADRAAPDDVIVVLLPDGGRGYLSKVFDDEWLAAHGFDLPGVEGTRVGDLLAAKGDSVPALVWASPGHTLGDAIDLMRRNGVSRLPVFNQPPPVRAAEVVGAVHEDDLLKSIFDGRATAADRVGDHLAAPLPIVGIREPVQAVLDGLTRGGSVLVLADGQPCGVLSCQDVLGHVVAG
jgi:cystathionine beta-synthase